MKRFVLITLLLGGIIGSASAQRDDLYFVPKKKTKTERSTEKSAVSEVEEVVSDQAETLSVAAEPTRLLEIDEDAYNRRGSYLTEQGEAVSDFTMDDDGFVLITEEGDTMWMNTDTLRLARVADDDGWIGGFDGSDSDYEYAMRIVRFRNPRYAIPVSSPLYWDVVYGNALWPSWEWNIYDDGVYAYVFPTSSNWYYWDYMMSYPYGWSHHWTYPYGYHYGHHWNYHCGYHYGHMWYDPWYHPHFYGYNPGWHHGYHHHHHGYHPGIGHAGWNGPKAYPNHRTATTASTRRTSSDAVGSASRTDMSSSRTGSSATRRTEGASSGRVVTGRESSASSSSNVVRSSSRNYTGNDEVVRRSTGSSSSVSRSTTTGSSRTGGYTRQSSSRSSSSASYSRPSNSSSSVNRSSVSGSSSRSSSYSSSGSSSYSSGSSSRSSYSSGSRSGGSSYSSGSSRSSGSRR